MSSKHSSQVWLLLGVLSICWGTSFLLIKLGLDSFDGVQLGSLRILFAGISLLPIVFRDRGHIKKNQWIWVFLSGVMGYFLPAILFGMAGKNISSSLSGTLNSLTPIFVLILGALFFGIGIIKNQVWGLIVAFLGSLVLVFSKEANPAAFVQSLATSFSDSSVQLAILATIFYGVNVNILGKYLKGIPALPLTANTLALMIPLCLFMAFSSHITDTINHPNFVKSLLIVIVLGTVNSAFMMILFNKLLSLTSPVIASSVTYLIPIVATSIGFFVGEDINIYQIGGMAIVLIGVFMINSSKK